MRTLIIIASLSVVLPLPGLTWLSIQVTVRSMLSDDAKLIQSLLQRVR